MACWYEVFDNEDVQLSTRRKVTALSVVAATSATATLVCLSAAASGHLSAVGALAFIIPIWIATVAWCVYRLKALRRVAWCLKISSEAVVAYDYTRKKIMIPWSRIERLEWTDQSVQIVGPAPYTIEIPSMFADFPALSHSLLDRARERNVRIGIEGREIEEIDVYELYPFLRELRVTSCGKADGGLTTT
jgi:hypothetical protein